MGDNAEDSDKNQLQNMAIVFGLIGGILTTVAFVPSVIKLIMDHHSQTVSFLYTYLAGQVLWLVYGALGVASGAQGFAPSLIFAIINLALSIFMVMTKHGGVRPECNQKGYLPTGCISPHLRPFLGTERR